MVKINRVYTKTGDDGTTGLVDGSRVSKDSLRVAAYGELDELNSFIGSARTLCEATEFGEFSTYLSKISNDLFDVGAELATPSTYTGGGIPLITEEDVTKLEGWLDLMNDQLPELRSFVLPGGTQINSALHIARAVSRRVERSIVTLSKSETVRPEVLEYINRLSDLLFVMSRYAIKLGGEQEFLWVPGVGKP